ncbi:MAG: MGMT family protein [Planctomycetes bacterium]|nr:MGMT family protein [Planctomycetota bacterium]
MTPKATPPAPDELEQRLRATVDAVPAGCVTTYGRIAEEAGLPGRARRVGRLLKELPAKSPLPWHRVVGASGRSSLPPGSRPFREQRRRLKAEGVPMDPRGKVDLVRYGWRP